ncbi:MAG: hypothetical protein JNK05_11825 [Myxococcales bacterium]|nr:hypothetical protein [Myxococcales bacterium]
MAITHHLDGWSDVRNFDYVHIGPGIYVLFDGRAADANIVYVGKSIADIVFRVSSHHKDKEFSQVGVILPRRTDAEYIHNFEHYVLAEYKDRFGQLPYYNRRDALFIDTGPRFNWHTAIRRVEDLEFSGEPIVGGHRTRTYAKSVAELRRLHTRLYNQNPCWTADDAWEEVSRRLQGVYAPSTLKQYAYELHGNQRLDRLR